MSLGEMLRRWWLVGAIAVALIALLVYVRSDRRRVHRALDRAENLMEKAGAEDQLSAFGNTRKLVALFAPGFLVRARPYEGAITDLQQLAAVIHRYRSGATALRISDRERKLELNRELGIATLTFVADVDSDYGGSPGRASYRIRIDWVRHDGAWLIHDFELVEVLAGRSWW